MELDQDPAYVFVAFDQLRFHALMRVDLEAHFVVGTYEAIMDELLDLRFAMEGTEIPGQGEKVAPPAIGMDMSENRVWSLASEGIREGRQPIGCESVDIQVVWDLRFKAVEGWEVDGYVAFGDSRHHRLVPV